MLAVVAVSLTPAVAPPALASDGGTTCADPMAASTPVGSAAGFTIYTTGDATFANGEIEGSIAVGGTAAFGNPGDGYGDYAVRWQAAGNGDYTVPTIDGDSTRMLLNRFDTASGRVPHLITQKEDPSYPAVAKLVNVDQGFVFERFGADGTAYKAQGSTNQSPQIQSETNLWSKPGHQFAAEGSFTDYFAADAGVPALSAVGDWRTPSISGDQNQTVIALDGSGANRIEYEAVSQAEQFRMENWSESSPLVVHVSASDVRDGTLILPSYMSEGGSPEGQAISYLLWDLSEITGAVSIDTRNGPIRGSIYAPNADITVPQRQLEGQVVARSFADLAQGQEIHTNLFGGTLCSSSPETPSVGGFSLSKALLGAAPSAFPDGTRFTVTASWTREGRTTSQDFELSPDGTAVEGPQDLPAGTVVSFSEPVAPEAGGLAFVGAAFAPETVTIAEGEDIAVVVTNTYSDASATPEPSRPAGSGVQSGDGNAPSGGAGSGAGGSTGVALAETGVSAGPFLVGAVALTLLAAGLVIAVATRKEP
jgi:choice-of-anchor A domain-containing protein